MGRREIAVAALRLLNAKPTASMADIAAAAGVSRATLHRHFAGREELVRLLGELSIESWREALDNADIDTATASGDAAQLRSALEVLCGQLVRDAYEHGFALTEPSFETDDEMVAASEVQQNRELAFYAAAQKAGVVRDDMSATWIAHAVFGLLVGLREALRRGDIAVRDAERLLRETVFGGIAVH
ncbi:TetR/AcrR family transcriptional regulator [Stackebrandtia nassauensis]|uniref:Transcriptional regulator, TetR family n=1 Tax=Stackebrandtia nassauensis (strain DSM 44728 / CIP 108903 / NRRL B-16338 / NBRC 102104 / LLR-40K-21) TaxID=446470 RepID=D3Q3Q5_STANL|nr:TetR/AcrR family transcriptional regulator [Stackebrandtia nassauensis]ADD43972.1 transcriptional regulator, TetR family [Stackebrandtia nassauensis DSM 44728]